jgi:predicted metal-dependent RNase
MPGAPRRAYLVHGEPPASQAFAQTLHDTLGWSVEVPALGDSVPLG